MVEVAGLEALQAGSNDSMGQIQLTGCMLLALVLKDVDTYKLSDAMLSYLIVALPTRLQSGSLLLDFLLAPRNLAFFLHTCPACTRVSLLSQVNSLVARALLADGGLNPTR